MGISTSAIMHLRDARPSVFDRLNGPLPVVLRLGAALAAAALAARIGPAAVCLVLLESVKGASKLLAALLVVALIARGLLAFSASAFLRLLRLAGLSLALVDRALCHYPYGFLRRSAGLSGQAAFALVLAFEAAAAGAGAALLKQRAAAADQVHVAAHGRAR